MWCTVSHQGGFLVSAHESKTMICYCLLTSTQLTQSTSSASIGLWRKKPWKNGGGGMRGETWSTYLFLSLRPSQLYALSLCSLLCLPVCEDHPSGCPSHGISGGREWCSFVQASSHQLGWHSLISTPPTASYPRLESTREEEWERRRGLEGATLPLDPILTTILITVNITCSLV